MLDEFTALESLEFLAWAIAYLRAYGVHVFHLDPEPLRSRCLQPALVDHVQLRRPGELRSTNDTRQPSSPTCLVFIAGYPPIRARRVPYFRDPEFTRRATMPPPRASDRLDHYWKLWSGWQQHAVLSPTGPALARLLAPGPGLDRYDLLRLDWAIGTADGQWRQGAGRASRIEASLTPYPFGPRPADI